MKEYNLKDNYNKIDLYNICSNYLNNQKKEEAEQLFKNIKRFKVLNKKEGGLK